MKQRQACFCLPGPVLAFGICVGSTRDSGVTRGELMNRENFIRATMDHQQLYRFILCTSNPRLHSWKMQNQKEKLASLVLLTLSIALL